MARNKPSKRELELSEQAKRQHLKDLGYDLERDGLDLEDYEDIVRMGPRQPRSVGSPGIMGSPGTMKSNPARDVQDVRLKELQDRRKAREKRRLEDYGATIRGEETSTQKETRKAAEAAPQTTTTTQTPVATTTVPVQPAAPSTPALNPASGAKRASVPTRAPLVSVGRNDRTGTTVTVNGQGMRPTTENQNLATELQRRQLLDVPNADMTAPLHTRAEVRLQQRRNAETQDLRDSIARRDAILTAGRKRSDEISWNRGEVRNARDWEHYGTIASADGWKKGEKSYDDAMTALRDKMKTLQGLADAGYMPSTGKAMAEFSKLIEGSDAGAGLTQKQVEVANKQLDSWLGGAQNRQARIEAGNTYRINQLRNRMGLAEGTSASDVLAADRAVRGKAVSGALEALSDPNVWNGPDYYKHLETIQRNANPNEGLASSFKAAMRDPATRQRYNDAVTNLTGGGMLPDDEGVTDLQNKFAIEHMQAQRSVAPTTASPAALNDEEKRRLGIQAAQGAGDALRPRRKGVA